MDESLSISACIITFNEADMIRDCLESVAWADEIVVVDSGSTDGTVAIAEEFGCRVVHQNFLGHVKQKDLAVRTASHRWVFCLDADERLEPGGEDEVRRALTERAGGPAERAGEWAGCFFPRRTFYLGGWVEHGGWWPEYRLRLFDRERGRWEGVDPHDHVTVDGPTRKLRSRIDHYNYRDIAHHMEKVNTYTTTMADRKDGAGERASLVKLLFNPAGRFARMYFLKQGFRDGMKGFVLAVIAAFYVFLKYAKLWERQRIETTGRAGGNESPD